MRYNSPLKIPKNEELEVPESTLTQFSNSKESCYNDDELEGILGIEEDKKDNNGYGLLSWDFMDWEEEAPNVEDGVLFYNNNNMFEEESHQYCHSSSNVIKKESFGFFDAGEDDDDDSKASLNLNLNLNYQQVLDAWSDRGPLLANEYSLSMGSNGYYMGEVPVMEEDRTRREASVMRYKEKRHTRLFSKKIRYQVRKLNADKRPRLKGRFVKRCSS